MSNNNDNIIRPTDVRPGHRLTGITQTTGKGPITRKLDGVVESCEAFGSYKTTFAMVGGDYVTVNNDHTTITVG